VDNQLDFALTVIKRHYNTNDRLKANKTRNKLKVSDSKTYRLKNEEHTKNDKEQRKIFTKLLMKTSRKRYGSTLAWIFFTETRFFTKNN